MDLQKVIFPTVALFVSTLVVAMFKPQLFANSAIIGKIIVVSLFVAGIIHLYGRIRDGLDRYTYDEGLHDSILDESEPPRKPYSRLCAGGFLLLGVVLSFGVGLVLGHYIEFVSIVEPSMFSDSLKPEFIFYPPIFVLFVDIVHAFASQMEL
jgi:hypothetical protein